jgi:transcription antitermination factor NusG
MSNIWYVVHPIGQYEEDVKAIAKEKGLKIIDAQFDDGKGVKIELTKKGEKKIKPFKKEAKNEDGE